MFQVILIFLMYMSRLCIIVLICFGLDILYALVLIGSLGNIPMLLDTSNRL